MTTVAVPLARARLEASALERVLDELTGRTWSPSAILLVCFDDDPEDLPALDE